MIYDSELSSCVAGASLNLKLLTLRSPVKPKNRQIKFHNLKKIKIENEKFWKSGPFFVRGTAEIYFVNKIILQFISFWRQQLVLCRFSRLAHYVRIGLKISDWQISQVNFLKDQRFWPVLRRFVSPSQRVPVSLI